MTPGWYPDPAGGPGQRWWDGQRWTEHTAVPSDRGPGLPTSADQDAIRLAGVGLVGAGALALLGAVLPWMVVSTAFGGRLTKSGIDGDGQISAAAGLVLLIVGASVLVRRNLDKARTILAVLAGGVIAVIGWVDMQDVNERIKSTSSGLVNGEIGIGLYMTIAAGGLGIVAAAYGAARSRSQDAGPNPSAPML